MFIYLLRHGESEANIQNLITGDSTDKLTHRGRSQAQIAGTQLNSIKFSACYVSSLYRAKETASLVMPDRMFQVDTRLNEIDAGEYAGQLRVTFEEKYISFFSNFDPALKFPGGESHQELFARSINWLTETATIHSDHDHILAVTHMGPICCMLQYAFEIPMYRFPHFKPKNGSLTVLYVPPQASSDKIKLIIYNCNKEMEII